MTDGPHRSLPLRKHWKDFAKRIDIEAYSLEENCQYLRAAVKKDFSEPVLTAVRNLLDERKRGPLPVVDPVKQIEATSKDCRGSAADNILIRCVTYELSKGRTGEEAFKNAFKNASEEVARANFRSIQEHYCREETNIKRLNSFRKRLGETIRKTDFNSIGSEVIEKRESRKTIQKLSKRTGVDEGPEL